MYLQYVYKIEYYNCVNFVCIKEIKLFHKIFSQNKRNVLNYLSDDLYLLLRDTLMKNFEMEGNYTYIPSRVHGIKLKSANLVFIDPDTGKRVFKKVKMYSCPTTKSVVKKGYPRSYDWKIVAGVTTHSVLILKRVFNGFIIKALIENLFPEYILYII